MADQPITVEDLPTWSQAGYLAQKEQLVPKETIPKYKANEEINKKVTFWMKGNSVKLAADAIVNAANSYLLAGGGICGMIHSAAGPELQEACAEIGGCPTGSSVVTPGFELPAKYVIHAVGPIGENPEALQSVYESVLSHINGDTIKSVALCCISTGIYGYPIEKATPIALESVRKFLEIPENLQKTERIIFVVFSPKDVSTYYQFVNEYFPLTVNEIKESKKKAEEKEVGE